MELPEFKVEAWLNKWEKSAQYDISQSSIAALTLEELMTLAGTTSEEFFGHLAQTPLDYGWIEGSPEFKQAVSQLYQNVAPDNILQMNGATGGNFLALLALVEPGDEIVSMRPSYQQLYDFPKSLGAEVKFIELQEENAWEFEVSKLAQVITSKTKVITLNNANNPTGTYLNRQQLEEVVALAKKVDAYVLVDEVYQPLEATDYCPVVDLYDKGISINSLSKTYSLPGLRIGWSASSREIADLFRKYRDYTTICGGVINDALAVLALQYKDKILARNRQIMAQNMATVQEWLETQPRVSLVGGQGVSTSFIKIEMIQSDTEFCRQLLQEKGVLLVPGSAFDKPGYARLGYCCQPEVLKEGLKRLGEFLAGK